MKQPETTTVDDGSLASTAPSTPPATLLSGDTNVNVSTRLEARREKVMQLRQRRDGSAAANAAAGSNKNKNGTHPRRSSLPAIRISRARSTGRMGVTGTTATNSGRVEKRSSDDLRRRPRSESARIDRRESSSRSRWDHRSRSSGSVPHFEDRNRTTDNVNNNDNNRTDRTKDSKRRMTRQETMESYFQRRSDRATSTVTPKRRRHRTRGASLPSSSSQRRRLKHHDEGEDHRQRRRHVSQGRTVRENATFKERGGSRDRWRERSQSRHDPCRDRDHRYGDGDRHSHGDGDTDGKKKAYDRQAEKKRILAWSSEFNAAQRAKRSNSVKDTKSKPSSSSSRPSRDHKHENDRYRSSSRGRSRRGMPPPPYVRDHSEGRRQQQRRQHHHQERRRRHSSHGTTSRGRRPSSRDEEGGRQRQERRRPSSHSQSLRRTSFKALPPPSTAVVGDDHNNKTSSSTSHHELKLLALPPAPPPSSKSNTKSTTTAKSSTNTIDQRLSKSNNHHSQQRLSKSDTDRGRHKEALRQAQLALLSSQLTGLSLENSESIRGADVIRGEEDMSSDDAHDNDDDLDKSKSDEINETIMNKDSYKDHKSDNEEKDDKPEIDKNKSFKTHASFDDHDVSDASLDIYKSMLHWDEDVKRTLDMYKNLHESEDAQQQQQKQRRRSSLETLDIYKSMLHWDEDVKRTLDMYKNLHESEDAQQQQQKQRRRSSLETRDSSGVFPPKQISSSSKMEYRRSTSTSSDPSNTNPNQTITTTTTTQTTTPRPTVLTDVKSSSLRSLRTTTSTESSKSNSSRLNRCLVLLSDPTQLEKSISGTTTTTNKKDENYSHAIVKRNDGAIVERTSSTDAIVERRRSHSADALIVRRDSETIGLGSMDDDEALYEYEDMTAHDETYVSSQQRTFNESIDVIVRDADTVGTMGIGSMAYASTDSKVSDSRQRRVEEEEEEEMNGVDKRGEDSIIDTQVITRPLKHRVSSLGRDDPSVEDDDTSAPSTVFEVNKLSFRALANHFRSPTKRISQIDSESCSLFPDAASRQEQDVSGKKIDEIMSKIMKCREKSSRYSTPKLNKTKNSSLSKNSSAAKASAKRSQPKKVPPPPPPPRRASETPVPVKKQADKPAPPPRNPPPARPIQVEAKTNTSNVPSRPPPPVTSTVLTTAMRRHASTGAVPESSRTIMPISPKPPKKDPIDHIMSQLQQLEQPSPAPNNNNNNNGIRPPIAQDTFQQDLASPLNRRNTTGNAPTKTPGRNDILSGGVSNMAYRDTKGGHGIYSGEVDQWGRPHGEGRIDYDSGDFFEGRWINGEPFHEPSTFQPGFGEMYPQGGGGGVMSHAHPAAPMYGGMMQAPYGGGNFNMSMNSFNNSMNFNPMMDPYFRRPG